MGVICHQSLLQHHCYHYHFMPISKYLQFTRTFEVSLGKRLLALCISCVLFSDISIGLAGYTKFGDKTCPNISACPYNTTNTSTVFSRACLLITSTLSVPLRHRGASDADWSVANYCGWSIYNGVHIQLVPVGLRCLLITFQLSVASWRRIFNVCASSAFQIRK